MVYVSYFLFSLDSSYMSTAHLVFQQFHIYTYKLLPNLSDALFEQSDWAPRALPNLCIDAANYLSNGGTLPLSSFAG